MVGGPSGQRASCSSLSASPDLDRRRDSSLRGVQEGLVGTFRQNYDKYRGEWRAQGGTFPQLTSSAILSGCFLWPEGHLYMI